MARFEGTASIRRALSMPDGSAQLDIKPDGRDWQWSFVPPDRARVALAVGIAAITGGWKLYLSLPDDTNSNLLEVIGLSKTLDRPEPPAPPPNTTPGHLNVAIAPTPVQNIQHVYTVTVTDSATGDPVSQADVTLQNYAIGEVPETIGPARTDANGQAALDVTLRPKITYKVIPGDHERIRVFTSPKLSVSATGFAPLALSLLKDKIDV
jgi:hypothetical protein